MLVTLEADQAVQEARFAGACQDQHAGRPVPSLGWPGERKSIAQQAETNVVSSEKNQSRLRGLGPSFQGAWGPGLGAGASRALGGSSAWGPGLTPFHQFFRLLKKSLGGRQAKGWETAETAATEVGAWREAGRYPGFHPFRY